MHLMTALMLKNPGKIFRGSVLVLQGRLLCHVDKKILLLSLFPCSDLILLSQVIGQY